MAAAEIPPDSRASADRRPGSRRWRFGWALAAMWAEADNFVGVGADTRFYSFASEAFAAAGEVAPERLLREVAERWQANSRTVDPQKPAVASLMAG
jgi:hypothetical protein